MCASARPPDRAKFTPQDARGTNRTGTISGYLAGRKIDTAPVALCGWDFLSPPEFLVHTAGPPAAVLPAVRAILAEIDADMPVSDVRTLDDMIGASVASRRFLMLCWARSLALRCCWRWRACTACCRYAVARRRAEIGMRIALGASGRGVVRLILAQGMRPVAIGLALGLVAAFALSRLMTSMLFEVAPVDAPTYVGVTALLALASVFSCWMPARRATKVDVMSALREE